MTDTEHKAAPSIRQRKELKRWAKGKLIKVRYEQEFGRLGWIASRLIRHECGCYTEYYLTKAGRAVIGNAVVSVPEEMP